MQGKEQTLKNLEGEIMRCNFFYVVIFMLCVFYFMPTISSAELVVDDVYREVYAQGDTTWNKKHSTDLGNFNKVVVGCSELDGILSDTAKAFQSSTITLKNGVLTIEGEGSSEGEIWDKVYTLIDLKFTIDQDYSFSLGGALYGNSYFKLLDENDSSVIFYSGYSDFDDTGVLSEGKYSLELKASANGVSSGFNDFLFTMEPSFAVPIPQTFWLLLAGSILLVCAKRQIAI